LAARSLCKHGHVRSLLTFFIASEGFVSAYQITYIQYYFNLIQTIKDVGAECGYDMRPSV